MNNLNQININSTKKEATKSKKSFLDREITLFNTFSDKKKEAFYGDLETLTKAGVDLKKSFEIILEEQEGTKDEHFYKEIYDEILLGKSLADSLKKTGKFSEYEYYSIVIGEESNLLLEILKELKIYYKKKTDLRKQIMSVMSYPIFVLIATIGIVYFLLTSLVPIFAKIYKQFDSELPSLTQTIVYISENMLYFVGIGLAILIGIIIFIYTQKQKIWFRKITSTIALKIPVLGNYVKKVHITRLTSSLQLLLSANTPLVKSLDLTKKMNSFYPLDAILDDLIKQVTKGKSLNEVMKTHSFFPRRFISLVKVGEETNELDTMLLKLSEQYYDELEHQTKIISKIMEPLMLLIIGGFVGVILIAIYLPLFNLSNII